MCTMIAFGLGPRACPAGSLSLLLAKQLTCAVLNAVVLGPPPDQPPNGLCHEQGERPEYYWEQDTRLSPVLALVKPARVMLTQIRV